jgi:hypothetical protein
MYGSFICKNRVYTLHEPDQRPLSVYAGSNIVKLAPLPGSVRNRMLPPNCFTMVYTVVSPSPIPLLSALVVK